MSRRPVPPSLRPPVYPQETLGSYVRRFEKRLSIKPGILTSHAREIAGMPSGPKVRAALHELVLQLTQLPAGTFQKTPRRRKRRFLCTECVDQEIVEVFPHIDFFCCPTHMRWTGLEPAESQLSVDPTQQTKRVPLADKHISQEIVEADITYRQLRSKPTFSPHLVLELTAIVADALGQDRVDLLTPDNYLPIVALLNLLMEPTFQRDLFNPEQPFAEARALLTTRISEAEGQHTDRLVDAIWLLLRPTFLAVREHLMTGTTGNPGVVRPDFRNILTNRRVNLPLQCFAEYITLETTRDWTVWRERHLVPGQSDALRRDIGSSSSLFEFICLHGHRYTSAPYAIVQAVQKGHSGCPYCAGSSALAGFNSMADTHPSLAREWHPEQNHDVTPLDITASGNSRKYWWQCKEGHAWEESPNNRARGKGCPFCSGRRAIPGETSLEDTHPDIASQWDRTLNTDLTPSDVRPGSGLKVGWICPRGHRYTATIHSRVAGSGCPVCANLRVARGFNDLATTHPSIAEEWDHEKNDGITPSDVVAGSNKKWHWTCAKDHSYCSSIVNRVAGKGCPICSGKIVLAGTNDLATIAPEVAKDWHPTLNGIITPAAVTAGSGRKVVWKCELGHDYEQAIAKRVAGTGCPICANKKVLPGFNDVATRFPEIASDWHPSKNSPHSPSEALPGNTRRWWKCKQGHEQLGTVPNRIKTMGCTACPRHQRVANPVGS